MSKIFSSSIYSSHYNTSDDGPLLTASRKKPFSAVTVYVENATSEDWEIDDISSIPDLVDVIKLQSTGPAEASRAIRKKLKYGNLHRQLRALTILDGLIQNAGERFQRDFVDEMLLERLRLCATSNVSDPKVKAKCNELFRSWASQYKNVRNLEQIASLYKQLPQRKKAITEERSKVIKETENPFGAEEEDDGKPTQEVKSPAMAPSASVAGSSHSRSGSSVLNSALSSKKVKKDKNKDKEKKGKNKAFNLEAEKGAMQTHIAQSSIASINLMNALRSINREQERVSDNAVATENFVECKLLRRKILRYIHALTDNTAWIGPLLDANDKLVEALVTYENLDKSIDADSDSDDEIVAQAHMYKMSDNKGKENELAPKLGVHEALQIAPASFKQQMPPAQSPRSVAPPAEDKVDEDENDPFGDSNAVETPATERGEPDWGMNARGR
ncbi:VHS domain protein [Calycina marina]|uniref:VHS domain protein n=1 Tax=Calycina marina TaxID=1763456 RepID=A0A9P8CGU8_9HELO|nr:VHS domain protein [Calycina marina]